MNLWLRHVHKLFHFSSRTNSVPAIQPRDPWDFPATRPRRRSQLIRISSPPRRSNRITQFLRQGLPFRRSGPQSEPPVVEVAPGQKFTRLAAAKLPEYKKVDDTRHPSRQQTTAPAQGDPTLSASATVYVLIMGTQMFIESRFSSAITRAGLMAD
ncbi:uncharacterized protein BJ212DRAFT_1486225 [Suillus subaureus]|uniref:Uncharacterized protein n=1 Tax=Suillus subaureus TaxID=48587 RepID=A0A9P7DXR4_9AGAM|nr:uncharacterized protein BJ212DRAFT_1486225 [Suillus subaureus]KAG1805663.1 hypothetical protein BJ212DRAFT_1486225 [Suillus subaureus]